jgi:signal transduction histidine kinase
LRGRLDASAKRRFHAGRPAPYDVLSQFSQALTSDADEQEQRDLPSRMARLLAEGTGAAWAQVWLLVADQPQLAAAWPAAADDRVLGPGLDPPGLRSQDVVLTDRRLGMLRLQERPNELLTPVEERLFTGLAAQAGLVLHGAQLRAELARRADDLTALAEELLASRRRVMDAHDAGRRRLERDIHDGAQQHLVALVVNLRLAQTLADRSAERAAAVLAEQGDAVGSAITTLIELSRGIYPQILAKDGVAAAVADVVSSSAIPVEVVDRGLGRYSQELESALYFSCVEAVQNAVKHASASRIGVELADRGGRITLKVRDDGSGFDVQTVLAAGGLGNLRDRVDAVGGDLVVRASATGGTEVVASVPAGVAQEAS